MKRRRRSTALPVRAADLTWAVPVVVAQRLTRMALAGPNPSARDRREFYTMGAEKVTAFYESWVNIAFSGLQMQQRFALSLLQACWFPWMASPKDAVLNWQRGALSVLNRGLAPVHRRATTNAKRLSRG
jgi:hypothetical protein